jgi:fermentation-respiration switch protein FrsA (DUF1100 family)
MPTRGCSLSLSRNLLLGPRLLAACASAAALALCATTTALAAPPLPFGHACTPSDGVLFCPTADDESRVPAFDGVPLDVDVTLPADRGDGPFPTIVMLHGFGQSKTVFEAPNSPFYNNDFYAQRGYAVVNASARGFGRSCGTPSSRTAGCERGWIHLADQRYEARDVQELLGSLVDQGIADPGALGVTGVSYGGGQSMELAFLRNRVRLPDGSFVPWRSPAGTPLSLSAAYPRWPWSDLADALQPNGRYRYPLPYSPAGSVNPVGVSIQSYVDGLYLLANLAGFVAPAGADPEADITSWNARIAQGEPYGADVTKIVKQLQDFHGASGLLGHVPAPMLLQSGWTDNLFPVGQSLRIYDAVRRARPQAIVSLQLGDLGHDRAGNHPGDIQQFSYDAASFFDAYLRGQGVPPASGSVKWFAQACPDAAPSSGPPRTSSTFDDVAHGQLTLTTVGRQHVSSAGGDQQVAAKLSPPIGPGTDACQRFPVQTSPGTAIVTRRSPGFTMAGLPVVVASVDTSGDAGQLDVRLWDVDPATRTQLLVDRGVYRLRRYQRGQVLFELNGNAYRFAKGHTIKVEVLGRDAPTYRASKTAFSVKVSALTVSLPTRERLRGASKKPYALRGRAAQRRP